MKPEIKLIISTARLYWSLCVSRLLSVLATEHTLLRMFLNIWRQILFPGDLHGAAPKNFCTNECGNVTNNYECPLLPNYRTYST